MQAKMMRKRSMQSSTTKSIRRRTSMGSHAYSFHHGHHAHHLHHKKRSTATKSYSEIPGLFQIKMSPSLQSVLSCRIGINITNTDRWMYIYKQKLLDELKQRQSNKDVEFLQIRAEIQAFPEDYILIGSYGNDEFILCLSEYAKNVCENWKQEEKKKLMKRLFQYLSRDTLEWHTLGSDSEIDRVIYNRSPFCAELILKPHLNVKFDMRLVTDVRDGYAEFVNTRTKFNILFRKRLDKASQASRLRINKYTQTIAPASFNRGIQYSYTYQEIKTNNTLQLKINKWFTLNYRQIRNAVEYNSYIDIYTNDYLDLPNQKTRYSIENPSLLLSFHDCIACHGKVVNCIAWNAQMSGVIAAAYGRVCPKYVTKMPPVWHNTHEKEMDTYLVLIWSVTQPGQPLLYLHAPREITAMNFCPYDQNILVGGCCDGQIVVWDMNGKFNVEKKEKHLQAAEVTILIKEKMDWMQYPPNDQNVFPCIQSKADTSHKTHITVIKWLPPEYELNNQGEFIKNKNNEEHMQFLTTAVGDSLMFVWDLKPKNKHITPKSKKTTHRLSSRPKTLDEKTSPLAKLNYNFKPMFKLIFIDADTNGPIHVNDFSFKMGSFSYVALNPETKENAMQRTYFVRDRQNESVQMEKNFLTTSEFGQLYHCTWTAFDYDQGLELNRQKIDTIPCRLYHDGPIYHMQRSPFCDDLLLTTGGRIFAIWDTVGEQIKKPILWRKAAIRYVMAVWSLQNSASIIAAREDGKIELWDLDEDSKSPLRMTKLLGDQLLSLFVNNSFSHVMKGTCITTDLTGILSIYSLASKLFVFNKKSIVKSHIQHFYEVKAILNYWIENVKKKKGLIDESQEDDVETPKNASKRKTTMLSAETKTMSFEVKKSPGNMWQEKEYRRMYKILLEKHRINMVNVNKGKGPLNELVESRSARLRKIDKFIANKEQVFQEEKLKLTSTYEELSRKKRISIRFPREIINTMKEQFYEDYKIAEMESIQYIQAHQYRYYFNWMDTIHQATSRYNGQLTKKNSSQLRIRSRSTRNYMDIIPPDVDRKNTRVLMAEIALITNISGK